MGGFFVGEIDLIFKNQVKGLTLSNFISPISGSVAE